VELPLCGSDFLSFAFCTLIFEFDAGQWAGWGQQYHGVVDSSLRQGQFGPGKTVSVTSYRRLIVDDLERRRVRSA
jgi:hypothetical protein